MCKGLGIYGKLLYLIDITPTFLDKKEKECYPFVFHIGLQLLYVIHLDLWQHYKMDQKLVGID